MQRCELGGSPVIERTVRSLLVVIATPRGDDGTGSVQTLEPVVVQALVAKTSVEAFHKGVLRRLARGNELELHAVAIGPLIQSAAGELRSLVGANCLRQAAKLCGLVEHPRDVQAGML